jgi:hypothetical protein
MAEEPDADGTAYDAALDLLFGAAYEIAKQHGVCPACLIINAGTLMESAAAEGKPVHGLPVEAADGDDDEIRVNH